MANKGGMNKQMEKGKGREQWGRESCCWKEDDAGCVPLPMLDWGPCHPAWHGGSARASCRTTLVWGALMLELLLHPHRGEMLLSYLPGGVVPSLFWSQECWMEGAFPVPYV